MQTASEGNPSLLKITFKGDFSLRNLTSFIEALFQKKKKNNNNLALLLFL